MKSRIFSFKLLKTQLNGGIFFPILLGVAYLLAFPVAELLMIDRWMQDGYAPWQMLILCENLYRDGLVMTGMAVAIASAFMMAIWNFCYLYSRERVDYYHSLPVNRTHLFLQKLVMSILFQIVPYLVMLFFALAVGGVRGYFQASWLPLAFAMVGKHFLAWLFTYFCTVLIIAMTGNVLMGVLSVGGFCLYGPALSMVLSGMEGIFFVTARGDKENGGIVSLLRKLTPYTFFEILADTSGASWNAGRVMGFLICIVLAGMLAWTAYRKRPSESTGKSVIYGWFEELLKYLLVIPCGLGVGMLFYMGSSIQSSLFWWCFALLLGTVMAKGLLEVLFALDFKAFFQGKRDLVLCLILVAGVSCVFHFDLLGYDRYLPSYGRIKGITLSPVGEYNILLKIHEEGVTMGSNSPIMDPELLIQKDESELGTQIYEAVREIVNTGKQLPEDGHYRRVTVGYCLKSGMWAYRSYNLTPELLNDLLSACYEEGNFKTIHYEGLNLPDTWLAGVRADFGDGQETGLFLTETADARKEQSQKLLQAFQADVEEAGAKDLTGAFPVCRLDFDYEKVPLIQTPDHLIPGRTADTSIVQNYYVYPSFRRTLVILEKTGYPLTGEEILEEFPDMDMNAYIYDDSQMKYYGPYAVEQEMDQKELADLWIYGEFDVPWLRTLDAHICLEKVEGEDITLSLRYQLPASPVTGWIQKLLEQKERGELKPQNMDEEYDYGFGLG